MKKAFSEVLTCNVNFPPIDTIDMTEIKFYNSVIFMSVAVAIASAINLAMLFRYIIRSRAKQTAIFMLCGCTSNKNKTDVYSRDRYDISDDICDICIGIQLCAAS